MKSHNIYHHYFVFIRNVLYFKLLFVILIQENFKEQQEILLTINKRKRAELYKNY